MNRFFFPAYKKIKKRGHFLKVQKEGKPYRTDFFIMLVYPTEIGYSRLGVTITKKNGNACFRNKKRRWIREIYRTNPVLSDFSADIVFIVKKRIINAKFTNFKSFMLMSLKKALDDLKPCSNEKDIKKS